METGQGMRDLHTSKSSGQHVTLARGVTMIGRAQGNDMVLESSTVSQYHAKIITFEKTIYIQDLSSTHGTSVNGRPVHFYILRVGDTVGIGDYSFVIGGVDHT